MKKYLLLLSIICSLFADRVDLESYATSMDSILIAILPFRNNGDKDIGKNKPWHIIADDLRFCGHFFVHKANKVDSSSFHDKKIALFIDGEYSITGGIITIECYLHEATTLNLLVGKKFKGEIKHIRRMAHRYSNQILDILLGEKGLFETKIVFVKDVGKLKNITLIDYDGYNEKMLTDKGGVNIFPTFLDTTTILWTSFLRGKPDIYKGSLVNGVSSIFIYSRYVEISPAVSDVVGRIVYASSRNGNMDIYSCTISGADKKQLTFMRGIDTSPCWSPNGYHIAFTSDRSGQPQIYLMDTDGVNTRRITFNGKYQDSPAWSPKGDRIVYASLQNGKFDIWTIKPDGSCAEKITNMPGNNEYPAWSPTASHIVFVSRCGLKSDLFVIRPDGSGLKQITTSGKAKMPDWSSM